MSPISRLTLITRTFSVIFDSKLYLTRFVILNFNLRLAMTLNFEFDKITSLILDNLEFMTSILCRQFFMLQSNSNSRDVKDSKISFFCSR